MQRLFILLLLCTCQAASAQVILSEVMYNPRLNDNAYEFIEIFNASATDTVPLFGWRIGDQAEVDSLISPDAFYRLAPQQFAVVLDPGYFLTTGIYDSLIPANALILTINDNTFGSGGLSNSTAETVVLVDAAGNTAARYTYSLGNADGISDEKILLSTDDSPGNWANSLRLDGTPGQRNSVTPHLIDGALVAGSFIVSPASLHEEQSARLNVTVRNGGLQNISIATVEFWITSSTNLSLPHRLGEAALPQALKFGDTVHVDFEWKQIAAGRHELAAILILPVDEDRANDTLRAAIIVSHLRNTVRINEIMYDPPAGQPEWIEIFNPQPKALALGDWLLEDESGTRALIPRNVIIQPQSYLVLATSSAVAGIFHIADSLVIVPARFPTLNNSGDVLLLRDFSGAVVDSVAYQMDWGAPKLSSAEKAWHERDNVTANWQPSQDPRGGTPAALNSVSPREVDLAAIRLFFDPLKPHAGDNVDITAVVLNRGRQPVDHFDVTFANDHNNDGEAQAGEELGTVTVNHLMAAEDSILARWLWPQPVSGRHHILVAVSAPFDTVQRNDRIAAFLSISWPTGAVRINEIMFAPSAGQPEWIEIFNPQTTTVPLTDWLLQNEDGSRSLVPSPVMIPAHGYLVLAEDSTVASAFNIADSLVIVLKSFPRLNNAGDVVLLQDFSGVMIDSAAYQASWGAPGISAEKVWYERENAAANWQPSQDPRHGTPGALNSVSPREIDLAAVRVWFDPPKPRAGDDVYINAVVLNRSRSTVDRFVVTFANDRNQDGVVQGGEEIGRATVEQAVAIEDSVVVRRLWPQPLSGRHRIFAIVSTPLDAVPSNDRSSARLSVGYGPRSVVINEISHAPNSGEAEWVEFYNRSSQPVDLSEWRWRDASAKTPLVFPDSTLIIPPGEFALLAKARDVAYADPRAKIIVPKTWPALNNTRDQLVLADFHGRLQDSLSYSQNWGGQTGVSLERINPHLAGTDSSNWSSCVDPIGSTPGRRNSIFTEFVPSQATVTASPQPFSPDGDGYDDVAIIQIQVPATTAAVHLKIYDVRGRLVHQLLNNAPVGATHQVVWNGRDAANQPVPMGLYIVYLQAIHATGGILVEARTTLVLARKLN